MARKTEKGGKFRNVHCRTWTMARKLKIMENAKVSSRTARAIQRNPVSKNQTNKKPKQQQKNGFDQCMHRNITPDIHPSIHPYIHTYINN